MAKQGGDGERKSSRSASESTGATSARERVLEAAERHFAERGVAATALREIAVDAGVAINLISYHFRTKDELLEAVLERHAAMVTAIRQEQLTKLELRYSPNPPPVREIISALIGPVFRMREQSPDIWASFVGFLSRERGSAAWAATIGKRVSVMVRQHSLLLHRALPSADRSDLTAAVTLAFLSVLLSSSAEVESIVGQDAIGDWDDSALEDLLIDMMTAAVTALAR